MTTGNMSGRRLYSLSCILQPIVVYLPRRVRKFRPRLPKAELRDLPARPRHSADLVIAAIKTYPQPDNSQWSEPVKFGL